MKDCFGREIDYLRISITDRCNLRCRYCMPDGMSGKLCHEDVLRYEEFLRIVRAASRLGIRHLKVTGGEPLVRRGCPAFIGALKAVEGIQTVTLTTNGLLLRENLDALVQAGVDGINVSLDTTDPQQYRLITGDSGAGGAEEASAALLEAAKRGIRVKVNAVTMPGTDVLSLISFAREHPVDVRFIEMMPIGYGRLFPDSDNRRLIARLAEAFPDLEPESEAAMELLWEAAGREKAFSFAERHSLERITKKHGEGPAVYFHIPGYQGSIGQRGAREVLLFLQPDPADVDRISEDLPLLRPGRGSPGSAEGRGAGQQTWGSVRQRQACETDRWLYGSDLWLCGADRWLYGSDLWLCGADRF